MATDIVIPTVGESVTSGVIAAWLKQDGEWVERDETVLELETDKITMELPAPAAGVLKRTANEGDEVEVGATVGSIDESAEKPAGAAPAKQEKAAAANASATTAAPPKPAATETKASPEPKPAQSAPAASGGDVSITPAARKLADELGVNPASIVGTGPGHRVREMDVLAFHQAQSNGSVSMNGTAHAAPARGSRNAPRESMSRLRQRVAERLVDAQHTAAMLTTFNEIDMTAVMDLRKKYKEDFAKKHDINLGFMSFFVAAATSALRAFPMVNAFIAGGDKGPEIEKHDYCDVAIAVSSPKGLVVPVLRNAEGMSFATIEKTIKELAIKARDGKLTIEEMTGGTFTITNGGIFGSMMSTPILNPPQSAILGMHAITKRAVEDPSNPGSIALRPMMYVALSYDHRIIDGADAVSFLVHIKKSIEDPSRILLDM
ncbi:MAG: 2-oxoglutarate dehydrogenase complex dihydrolipoyllysine-residue succinyltransferase [Phycisphaeraceae bacterium]|nr:2-oxoglutarate dehydrogenase complex dihydrolipoyllysine-residue succinyltransferase [Phycisphaerales bacterium]MCB9859183.1 2-oxoglutarate dehydrogenase complex dihydrolipoyllysine-residue succinyltransferase [Phycisphaeraceae bacterium]